MLDKVSKELKNFIKYSLEDEKKKKDDDEEEYTPKCRC